MTYILCNLLVQIHRQFRKPLIVMSPKNLLRHPECKSPLAEFDEVPDDKGIIGVRFKRLIMDEGVSDRCYGLGFRAHVPLPASRTPFQPAGELARMDTAGAVGSAAAASEMPTVSMLICWLSMPAPSPPREPQVKRVLMYSGEFMQCC